jgi:hypothetical protein
MTALGTAAALSNALQAGTSALSLASLAKTLISAPGISLSADMKPLFGSGIFPAGGTVPYGSRNNFDIITNERVQKRAQITDHYTEENYAIQDHVAFDPTRITLSGEVGELVFSRSATERYVQAVLDRLGPLGVISPELTVSTLEYLSAYNRVASSVSNAMTRLEDIAGLLGVDSYGLNKQQAAHKFFSGIFENRLVVDVDTPWFQYKSMLIESLDFEQGEDTKDKSTVTVSFKELRTVSALEGTGPLKGRIFEQMAPTKDMGVSRGTSTNTSIAKTLFGSFL